MKELGVDFLAAGVLKYLLGSAGLGVLLLPPRALGAGVADRDRLVRRRGHLRDGHLRLLALADARRFQSGTPPVPSIYAGIAGIELMQEIGIAETQEHVNALNERLIAGVDELGGTVATPRKPSGAARSSASGRRT